MKVKIKTKDFLGDEYQHDISNVFSIYEDKREIFIRYMKGEFHEAYRFRKEVVISLEVKI